MARRNRVERRCCHTHPSGVTPERSAHVAEGRGCYPTSGCPPRPYQPSLPSTSCSRAGTCGHRCRSRQLWWPDESRGNGDSCRGERHKQEGMIFTYKIFKRYYARCAGSGHGLDSHRFRTLRYLLFDTISARTPYKRSQHRTSSSFLQQRLRGAFSCSFCRSLLARSV